MPFDDTKIMHPRQHLAGFVLILVFFILGGLPGFSEVVPAAIVLICGCLQPAGFTPRRESRSHRCHTGIIKIQNQCTWKKYAHN